MKYRPLHLTGVEAYRAISNKTSDKPWYRIENRADSADVYIFDEIGFWGTTAQEFVDTINAIDTPSLNVYINSVGGNVFDGVAIYNALRGHKAHVTTQVEALGASIASVIFQAGDDRVMVTHSQLMIHDAMGCVCGNMDDMLEFAEVLDRLSGEIASIYAERGDSRKNYRALMKAETWFGASEAVAAKLADRVYDPPKKKAADNKIDTAESNQERVARFEAMFTQAEEGFLS